MRLQGGFPPWDVGCGCGNCGLNCIQIRCVCHRKGLEKKAG